MKNIKDNKTPKKLKKNTKKRKPQQLDLELKQPIGNSFAKAKSNISKNFRFLEVRRFIRSPYSWIFIMLSLSLISVQIYFLITKLNLLPVRIPIYFNSIELADRLGNQTELYIFPIISGVIVIATTLTGYQLYNSQKELISFSLLNMFLSVSVITYVFLRIFAMYL